MESYGRPARGLEAETLWEIATERESFSREMKLYPQKALVESQ
jgi:hypothetical protein